jgi:nitrite reductase/ring-hydroxylating ferredoxin subunit
MTCQSREDGDRLLCRLEDLPDGRSRGFDPLGEGRDTMFIVRKGDDLFAYRNACPHYDRARMAWKKNEFLNGDRSRIMCAAHGAEFTIETGRCTIGPCLGQSLKPVPLALRDGMVWLVGDYAPGRPARAAAATR